MHNPLDPPIEETISFVINTGLSSSDNEILDMVVYPNPVDGNYVTILSPVEGLKEIQVFTVTGRKVMDTAVSITFLPVTVNTWISFNPSTGDRIVT